MASVRYNGCKRSHLGTEVPPCWIMDGTKGWELYHSKKPIMKMPGQETLDGHMADLDAAWRRLEGRKPYAELTERERMQEGSVPWTLPAWNALLAREAAQESNNESEVK